MLLKGGNKHTRTLNNTKWGGGGREKRFNEPKLYRGHGLCFAFDLECNNIIMQDDPPILFYINRNQCS